MREQTCAALDFDQFGRGYLSNYNGHPIKYENAFKISYDSHADNLDTDSRSSLFSEKDVGCKNNASVEFNSNSVSGASPMKNSDKPLSVTLPLLLTTIRKIAVCGLKILV